MKLQQLSVFLVNRPGQLRKAVDLLAKAGISISSLMLADTREFGILRLLMHDVEKARRVLEENQFIVKLTEVLALEVEDQPGGLAALLEPIESSGLNIEYMYAFASGGKKKAVMIFRFSETDRALEALKSAGINVIGGVDLLAA